MPEQSRADRKTQNRVIGLLTEKFRPDCLGYHYLGVRRDRVNNRCVDTGRLRANFLACV
jgi:type I restriction enzyme R subunit